MDPCNIVSILFENKEILCDQHYLQLMNLTKNYYLTGNKYPILEYLFVHADTIELKVLKNIVQTKSFFNTPISVHDYFFTGAFLFIFYLII